MKQRIKKRFQVYWKLELLNALLLPAVFVLWMLLAKQTIGWFCFACFVPTATMLVIGGTYWKVKLDVLEGNNPKIDRFLDASYWLKHPLLFLTCVAIAMSLSDVYWIRLSKSTGDRIGGIVATILAALEYLNYYHVQLQHFDHGPDFHRLVTGKGFRPSHLARDLEEQRASLVSRGAEQKKNRAVNRVGR